MSEQYITKISDNELMSEIKELWNGYCEAYDTASEYRKKYAEAVDEWQRRGHFLKELN